MSNILMRTALLLIALGLGLSACRTPATPVEIDAAVSALVDRQAELTPRELDREAAGVIRLLDGGDYTSPYELPGGRTVAWSAVEVFDHVYLMPVVMGKTTVLIPQSDYDWEGALTVYDEYGREIFHREVRVE